MKLYIISLIFINTIFSIFPNQSNIADNFNNSYADDINSNSIYEIIELEDRLWLRTGAGLSFIDYDDSNLPSFHSIIYNNLPEGGSPAFFINDDIMIISGSKAVYENGRYRPMGTGISWSIDDGDIWNYIEQPIDSIPD